MLSGCISETVLHQPLILKPKPEDIKKMWSL